MTTTTEIVIYVVTADLNDCGMRYDETEKSLREEHQNEFQVLLLNSEETFDKLKTRISYTKGWAGSPELGRGSSLTFIAGKADVEHRDDNSYWTRKITTAEHITIAETLARNTYFDQEYINLTKQDNRFRVMRIGADDRDAQLDAIKIDVEYFKFIRQPLPEVCMEALKQRGELISYCTNQTEELCIAAVRQNPRALICCTRQSENLCMEAVRQDGRALMLVQRQTLEICRAAVQNDQRAAHWVEPRFWNTGDKVLKENSPGLLKRIWYNITDSKFKSDWYMYD